MKIKFSDYYPTAKLLILEAKCKKPKLRIQIDFLDTYFRLLFPRNKQDYININFFKDIIYFNKTYAHHCYSEPQVQVPPYQNLVIVREPTLSP